MAFCQRVFQLFPSWQNLQDGSSRAMTLASCHPDAAEAEVLEALPVTLAPLRDETLLNQIRCHTAMIWMSAVAPSLRQHIRN
jgi:hypothetical protein